MIQLSIFKRSFNLAEGQNKIIYFFMGHKKCLYLYGGVGGNCIVIIFILIFYIVESTIINVPTYFSFHIIINMTILHIHNLTCHVSIYIIYKFGHHLLPNYFTK